MKAFSREVLYRVLIIGAVLFGAGILGFQWLPLFALYVFMGAANEHLAAWTKERRRQLTVPVGEPHRGADMAWADELDAMLHQPLAIEAAVKVHTGELEQAVREWSGAT